MVPGVGSEGSQYGTRCGIGGISVWYSVRDRRDLSMVPGVGSEGSQYGTR